MQKFMGWLNDSFAPKMQKVAHNFWVAIIKDTMLQILPFILLGSLFCVGAVIENYVSLPFSFWTPFGWTMGKVSLLVALLLPFNYCEKKRLRKTRLVAAGTGLLAFCLCCQPQIGDAGLGADCFGAGGMFVAMFTGVVVSLVFGAFGKFSFFKEDSAMPDFVRQWFDSLLPIGIIMFTLFIVVIVCGVDLFAIVASVFAPLEKGLNTLPGYMFMSFLQCFIYSMGISGWCLAGVTTPVKAASIVANISIAAAGVAYTNADLNIFTETFQYCMVQWWGGIGCTFMLVILMCFFAKSNKLKSLGKACLGPAVLNINEPVVFGAIAWNPILMVPMWLMGIVHPLCNWIFTKVIPLIALPTIDFEVWYMPYPISTFIASQGSIVTCIYAIVMCIVVAGLIWYPFFKVYDNQCVAEEAEATKEN